MKLITLILALFILVLSSIPCSDGINKDDTTVQIENHSDHSNDDCTLFCTCACCGIAIPFVAMNFEDEDINVKIISHNFKFDNLYTQDFITSVWQPPAVS